MEWNVAKDLALDNTEWKSAIHVPESRPGDQALLTSSAFFLILLSPLFVCLDPVGYHL